MSESVRLFWDAALHLLCAGTDMLARQLEGDLACIITAGALPNARRSRMYIDVGTSGGTLLRAMGTRYYTGDVV